MNRNRSALRCTALLVGAACFLVGGLSAQTIEWVGTGGGTANLSNAANWAPNSSLDSGTTWDLVFKTTGDSQPATSMIPGGSFTIRSLTMDNAAQMFNNASGVIRFVATTAASSTAQRTLTFGTADVAIITLTNNVNMNVNSSTLASTNAGTPSMTLNLGYTGNGTINIDGTSQLSVTGANATIVGTGGLIKTGEGTLRLSGNHTYEGGFTLEQGTVIITTSGPTTTSAVTASPWGTGTLTLLGGTIDSSTNNGRTVRNHTVLNGDITISTAAAGSGNFTWSGAAGQGTTLAGNTSLNITQTVNWTQVISGSADLTKTGTGTLRLDANHTYSGTTHVNEGTVILTAGSSLAGGLNVASGAQFVGAGTIHGAAYIAGEHSSGNSPANQTFASDLTYANGASVVWQLAAQSTIDSFDQITVGGRANFTGTTLLHLAFNGADSTVNWADEFWSTDHSWQIYDAAAVANFDNLSLALTNWGDSSGNLFEDILAGASFGLSTADGNIYLNYTAAAIPEPSTYAALLGLSALALVAYRRRGRRI